MEPALSVAGQNDRVFAHIGVEEIVDRGHQALVSDHQPGAPEDLLHLVVIDRLLAEDAAVEFAGGGVDDDVLPSGAHPRILPLAVMIAGAEADHHGGLTLVFTRFVPPASVDPIGRKWGKNWRTRH